MCGIAGCFSPEAGNASRVLSRMGKCLTHRGPDNMDIWQDEAVGIGLVHCRLSILDLSPAGHQPMVSNCDRYVLIFNGEIYNHLDLRYELEAAQNQVKWRGHSDTETLLEALRYWGLEKTLARLNGMFAFALWDRRERSLCLVRDRMGIKPLYYGSNNGVFLFGSELKALTAHPKWQMQINRNALALYLRHNYIPAPWSIYEDIFKLPPAHYVVVKDSGKTVSAPQCYWDLEQIACNGSVAAHKSTSEMVDELDSLLQDAVKKRMLSDVPLGAFLSGGYDSSMVVALMQAQSRQPVKTFSIGFHENAWNEAQYARAVASHLKTDHTELYVSPEEAMAVIPDLPAIWDEPFSDSSQIPTCLVSRLAREHVTVSLSGDGGDELFYGYDRYVLACKIWQKLRFLPLRVRRMLSTCLNRLPGKKLEHMQRKLPLNMQILNLADRLPGWAQVLATRDSNAFYRRLVSHWKHPDQVVTGSCEPDTILGCPDRDSGLKDFRERMMLLDMQTYLPDDILTKVDRASMATGLEARVPLLDHRVVEFAWRVPIDLKYCNGQSKWLLRQVLHRYVPRKLLDRPKMGFGVPIEYWLRGPLRNWAEALLDEQKIRTGGYLDPGPIRKMWNEHLAGQRRWHYYLWDILMFQAWLEAR